MASPASVVLASCKTLPSFEIDDRHLIKALTERGAEVTVLPWDDPGVPWAQFDACLIRTTWDYWHRRDAFVAWAYGVQAGTRLFNPASVIEWNTDKIYLKALAEAGFPVAPTLWLQQGQPLDLTAQVRSRGWRRAFIKPRVGAGAYGTLPFDVDPAGLQAAEAHVARLLPERPLMVQPFLESVHSSGEISLIYFDGALSHAVQKIPVEGDYRVQDDFGAWDGPIPPPAEAVALCEALLTHLNQGDGPLLYARVDLMEGDDGALLIVEVEVVEPSLFFRHGPQAAGMLADALLRRLGGPRRLG